MPRQENVPAPKMPAMPGRPRTLESIQVPIDRETLLTLRILLAGNQPRVIIGGGGGGPKAQHFGMCYDLGSDSRLQIACTLHEAPAKRRSTKQAKSAKPSKAAGAGKKGEQSVSKRIVIKRTHKP